MSNVQEDGNEYIVSDGGWAGYIEKLDKERLEQLLKNGENLSDKDKLLAEEYGLIPAKK